MPPVEPADSGEPHQRAIGIGPARVAGWMNRSFNAIAAELRFVDSESLDVLLYCGDDLAAVEEKDREAERAR
jgi:hypothetical protein